MENINGMIVMLRELGHDDASILEILKECPGMQKHLELYIDWSKGNRNS